MKNVEDSTGLGIKYFISFFGYHFNSLMNFIIPFDDPAGTRYSLVGSPQTISSASGKVYCHYEIHSVDKRS